MSRFELNERQRELLAFVGGFVAERRFCPSMREMVDGTSYRSTSNVTYNLGILKREGYVDFEKGKPRTVRVLRGAVGVAEVWDRS